MIDLVFDASRETTVEEINAAIKAAAEGPMKGVLGYSTAPLVSADFNHDPHSSTFSADGTNVTDGTLVRVLSWYDNEWGFATRMSDTALAMAKFL
jgi:glyceraldehyde 3-phosphate dehydrogenase